MDEQKALKEFQERIGYQFKDEKLLYEALSHSSFANENKKARNSNERLEFLGDSVLSIVVSDHIFEHYKHMPEGELTKMRASLVCEKALFEFSKKIELGKYIFLGKGEEITGGRERPSIISDAFEAVIAAIYLDGGFANAKEFIHHFILTDLEDKKLFYDSKTILQEIVQANMTGNVSYELIDEQGPDHNKIFEVEARIGGKAWGRGKGSSKKSAEQQAAYEAILNLRKKK